MNGVISYVIVTFQSAMMHDADVVVIIKVKNLLGICVGMKVGTLISCLSTSQRTTNPSCLLYLFFIAIAITPKTKNNNNNNNTAIIIGVVEERIAVRYYMR